LQWILPERRDIRTGVDEAPRPPLGVLRRIRTVISRGVATPAHPDGRVRDASLSRSA